MDPELVAGRTRAPDLCQALSATREVEADERRRILSALFGADVNCVVIDVCQVQMGSFTLFGPAVQILHRHLATTTRCLSEVR
jgi:maltose O-acetyltransferase